MGNYRSFKAQALYLAPWRVRAQAKMRYAVLALAAATLWSNCEAALDASLHRNLAALLDLAKGETALVASTGSGPFGLTISPDGTTLYDAEQGGQKIRKIDIATGTVAAFAGSERFREIVMSPDGSTLYAAASLNNNIKKIDVVSGTITTIVGNGAASSLDGVGTAATTKYPMGLAIHPDGRKLYIGERDGYKVRAVALDSLAVTTLAGSSSDARPASGSDGVGTSAIFRHLGSMVVSSDGEMIYIGDGDCLRAIELSSATVTTILTISGWSGQGIAISKNGKTVYFAGSNAVMTVNVDLKSPFYGTWKTLAGSGGTGTTNGVGTSAQINFPTGMALSPDGSVLYVNSLGSNQVRAIGTKTLLSNGETMTLATTGGNGVYGVAMSPDGATLFTSETGGNVVRAVDVETGSVKLFAGTGAQGYADNTVGTSAVLRYCRGIVITPDGSTLYLADQANHRIRTIDVATSAVGTLIGNGAASSLDGTGTSATTWNPMGLAMHPDGSKLYVGDTGCDKIRAVDLETLAVTTLAGTCEIGSTDGVGTNALFKHAGAMVVSPDGNMLYVGDYFSVRAVELQSSTVTTVATTGSPYGMAISSDGQAVYFADYDDSRVMYVNVAKGAFYGTVLTLAGSGGTGSADGIGTSAQVGKPDGISLSPDGATLYVALYSLAKIRAIGTGTVITPSPTMFPIPAPTSEPTLTPSSKPTLTPSSSKPSMVPSPPPSHAVAVIEGTCIHASSTVTKLLPDGRRLDLAVSSVRVGDRLVAVDDQHKEVAAMVVGLPHSPSTEDFMRIVMKGTGREARATLHHTFPMCRSDKVIAAMDIVAGNCLHTVDGQGIVESAKLVAAEKDDETYTVVLEGASLVAVGGIFTHAKMTEATTGARESGKIYAKAIISKMHKLDRSSTRMIAWSGLRGVA